LMGFTVKKTSASWIALLLETVALIFLDRILEVFLRVIVIWFSDANLDSPSAIETPKLPPPMMYFHTCFVFLSPTVSKG
jgi:hypothetical protein